MRAIHFFLKSLRGVIVGERVATHVEELLQTPETLVGPLQASRENLSSSESALNRVQQALAVSETARAALQSVFDEQLSKTLSASSQDLDSLRERVAASQLTLQGDQLKSLLSLFEQTKAGSQKTQDAVEQLRTSLQLRGSANDAVLEAQPLGQHLSAWNDGDALASSLEHLRVVTSNG